MVQKLRKKNEKIEEITIHNIEELLEYMEKLTFFKNENYCFRGQADYSWNITPSLFRNLEPFQIDLYDKFVQSIFIEKRPLNFTNENIEWLMLCQHYGLPTKLLDWTSDILTALFFSCYVDEEKTSKEEVKRLKKQDGIIFIINKNEYQKLSVREINKTKTDLFFISTYITNPRLRTQHGCFMFWNKQLILEKYIKEKKLLLKKIIIPSECKENILKELNEKFKICHETIYIQTNLINDDNFNLKKERFLALVNYITNAEKISESTEKEIKNFFNISFKGLFNNSTLYKQIDILNFIPKFNVETINKFLSLKY
ncbi:MAG: FRG domain-containing protein [Fusobacterium sp.]|uniref:FRG domain-containing protein n=1 Tax=Fusobacterium sp. TaxID=68766 RepID=UPI003996618B